jgi:long-chain fatty acid transport protein
MGLAIAGLSFGANATNGYFSHGYGMKAKGMAGVSTAMDQDTFGGANNPASMAFVGNRIDLGADLFSPIREASTSDFGGSGFSLNSESESNYFLIPEFGYNRMLNQNLSLGVTVYGNGGMNTDYPPSAAFGGANILGGSGSLGVDLMQLIIAPTAAFKVNADHAIGISPLLGYQRFKAEGLQGFAGISSSPGNLTNRGYDDALGYGVRVGYMGKLTPTVAIGAAYASKMNFDEFSKYSGLFAEQGDFDIPENYNLGVSWQATPQVKLGVDYQRINFSDINSVGNVSAAAAPLGANSGPGFGWDDVDVWKLGVEYKHNNKWAFRAGYSHTNSPIKGDMTCATTNCAEVTFNILAPAVIEDHATLGFTYTTASGGELTVAYMHSFKNDVTGLRPPPFNGGVVPSTDNIQMYQNAIGIAYGWKM